jgi:hypothetical protein
MIALREASPRARHTCVFVCVLTLSLFPGPLSAQTASVEQLQRRLDEREKLIDELTRRVEALEHKLSAAHAAPSAPPHPQSQSTPEKSARQDKPSSVPQVPPSGPGAPATQADEEQTNRALERALVREGGLVLSRGVYEIEPAFTYRHRARSGLEIAGPSAVTRQVSQRDIVESSVAFRLGLPWSSQVGLRMPYVYTRDQVASGGTTEQRENRAGWGDAELTWTTQFIGERGPVPSLLGTLSWTAPTGSFSLTDIASPGAGFHVVQAGLNAVKRQDPMVFYGSLAHARTLSRNVAGNEIGPGDTTSLKIGAILAASPDTSLRFAFEMSRAGKIELNGRKQPGSDTSVALLEFGLASVLSARTVLDLRIGIGLTPDSPNYRIGLALPVRFY